MKALKTALFIGFCHLFYILADQPFWDGLAYHEHLLNGQREIFIPPWIENGRPLIGYAYWYISQFLGPASGFKVCVLLSLFASSLLMEKILVSYSSFSKDQSRLIALLGVAYPAYQVHLAFTTTIFILCLPFLLFAFSQLMASESFVKQPIGRALGLASLAIAMVSECFVLVAFSFPILKFFQQKKIWSTRNILQFLKTNLDYFLVPFIYLILMYTVMKVSGEYSGSRKLNLNVVEFFNTFVRYTISAFDFNLISPWPLHRNLNFVFTLVLSGASAVFFFKNKPRKDETSILLMFMVLLLTALPFVIASRQVNTLGWGMRHLVPAAYPAIIIIGLLLKRIPVPFQRPGHCILILLAAISLNKDYLMWQAREAIDQSATEHFQQNEVFHLSKTIYYPMSFRPVFNEEYRFYEWSYAFKQAHPQETKASIYDTYLNNKKDTDSLIRFAETHGLLENYDSNACQSRFEIKVNQKINWKLGLEYKYKRYFSKNYKKWLLELSEVQFEKLKNCS